MADKIIDIPVGDVIVGPDRIRKSFRDMDLLADSFSGPNGQLKPITVSPGYMLYDGERRLRTAKTLGWETIKAHVTDKELPNPIQAEGDYNELASQLTTSERAEWCLRKMEELRSREAKPDGDAPPENRETVAKEGGFTNSMQFRKAAAVLQSGNSDLVKAMDSGAVTVAAAAKVAELGRTEQKAFLKAAEDGKMAATKAADEQLRSLIERKGVKALRDAVQTGDISLSTGAKIANVSLGKQVEAVKQIMDKKKALAEKAPPESKAPKNGRTKFDERPVRVCIDKLAKVLNARKNAHGDCAAYRKCVGLLEDLNTAVKDWQKGAK